MFVVFHCVVQQDRQRAPAEMVTFILFFLFLLV